MRPAVAPRCEMCDTEHAILFVPTNGYKKPNEWKFLCKHCLSQEYFIFISDFYFNKTHTEEWLKYLCTKEWFDIVDFKNMLKKYQHEWERAREF